MARERLKGPQLDVGDHVDGRYHLLEALGQGGFGTVWLADDLYSDAGDRRVAIKVLRSHLSADATIVARFRSAAEVMRGVRHQHVVDVIEGARCWEGFHYFVMQYIHGGDLSDAATARIRREQAIELLLQAGQAIAHAHRSGIVHGDVKPSNILYGVGPRVEAWVTDFDLFRWHGQVTTIIDGGMTVGFAAPESPLGRPTTRADVYGFAATVCFVLAGGDVALPAKRTDLVRAANPPAPLLFPLLSALADEPRYRAESLAPLLQALEQSRGISESCWPETPVQMDIGWATCRWYVGLGDEERDDLMRQIESRFGSEQKRPNHDGRPSTRYTQYHQGHDIASGAYPDPLTPLADQVASAVRAGSIATIVIRGTRPLPWSVRLERFLVCPDWQLFDALLWLRLLGHVNRGDAHMLMTMAMLAAVRSLGQEKELDAYIEHELKDVGSLPAGSGYAHGLSLLGRGAAVSALLRGDSISYREPFAFLAWNPEPAALRASYLHASEANWSVDAHDFVWMHEMARRLLEWGAPLEADLPAWSSADAEAVVSLDDPEFSRLLDEFVPPVLRLPTDEASPHKQRIHVARLLSYVPWAGAVTVHTQRTGVRPPPWAGPVGLSPNEEWYESNLIERMWRLSADELDAFIAASPLADRYVPPRSAGVQRRVIGILDVLRDNSAVPSDVHALLDRILDVPHASTADRSDEGDAAPRPTLAPNQA